MHEGIQQQWNEIIDYTDEWIKHKWKLIHAKIVQLVAEWMQRE